MPSLQYYTDLMRNAVEAIDNAFATSSQYKVRKILKDTNNAHLASQFIDIDQIIALEILGAKKAVLALQFTKTSQSFALQKLGARNAGIALQFIRISQASALKLLTEDQEVTLEIVNLALQFDVIKFWALDILGAEYALIALQFNEADQVLDLIEILKANDGTCVEQMEVLLNDGFDLAQEITCPVVGDTVIEPVE